MPHGPVTIALEQVLHDHEVFLYLHGVDAFQLAGELDDADAGTLADRLAHFSSREEALVVGLQGGFLPGQAFQLALHDAHGLQYQLVFVYFAGRYLLFA